MACQTGSAAASLCHNDDDIQIGSGVNGIMDEVQIFQPGAERRRGGQPGGIPVFFLPTSNPTPSPAYDDF